MKIVAAQCQIGCAVALLGRAAEGHRGKLAACDTVIDNESLRLEGVAADRIENAERAKRPGSVGTELNPCARLLGKMGALENFAVDPLPHECIGSGQSANAAACDECLSGHGLPKP